MRRLVLISLALVAITTGCCSKPKGSSASTPPTVTAAPAPPKRQILMRGGSDTRPEKWTTAEQSKLSAPMHAVHQGFAPQLSEARIDLPKVRVIAPRIVFEVFADGTNKDETYGAGRFLDAPAPRDGRIVLDFNKAYNPPCAFTPFATCPLPPAQNRLKARVAAGERRVGGH